MKQLNSTNVMKSIELSDFLHGEKELLRTRSSLLRIMRVWLHRARVLSWASRFASGFLEMALSGPELKRKVGPGLRSEGRHEWERKNETFLSHRIW